MKNYSILFAIAFFLFSCANNTEKKEGNEQQEVQTFLDEYNKKYQELYYKSAQADWKLQTMMIEGDTTNEVAAQNARKEMAAYTGGTENIEKAKKYLGWKDKLTELQVKQLNKVLYFAADNPQTIKETVDARIKAETEQSKKLYSFKYMIDGKEVTKNDIDKILQGENDLNKRMKAWTTAKDVGKGLKEGLVNLRELRNKTVQGLGYSDYFSYQVSDYGMTTEEMMALLRKINAQLYPLFRELHTFARYEFAKKYKVKDVPDYLPAHWPTNQWAQDWGALVSVEGIDLDEVLKSKTKEWIVEQGERFYVSLGFDSLPKSFWEKSDLYPLPKDATYKKNNHASAWHLDLDKDIRSLMSVEPNEQWYETSHHELGHIYYYMAYTNKDVPPVLREGANRAYHEAMGSMMGLTAMQKPFIANLGLIDANTKTDDLKVLLKEALNYVVFIPWSAGVMSEFEYELYNKNLPPDQFNKKWWEIVKKYQGVVPPAERGEEYCDATTKTHINDDAAQYYDYALSYIILFQLHDYISNQILKQDPRATNYYGNKEVGKFLQDIMYWGSSKDWRQVLKDKTGEELSARAMLKYFEPLMDYLKKENQGRKYSLPEKME